MIKIIVYIILWIMLILGFISGDLGGLQLAFFSLVVLFIREHKNTVKLGDMLIEHIELTQKEMKILKEKVTKLELLNELKKENK
jgi:hypothetical protein